MVWSAVLVMAFAAMIDPLRIGVTVLVISRPRPVLQLLAFWLGGLAMGLAVGIGALFLLRGPALRLMKDMPATGDGVALALVETSVGVVALLIAALVALGFPRRAAATQPRESALSRLTARAGDAIRGGSPWVAYLAGVALATPLQYVVALAAILVSGEGAATQFGALIVYHLVVLALAEIPLLGSLVAPAATYAVMLRLHDWVIVRRRRLTAVIVAVIGAFFFVNGVSGI
ncbi:GAP family protein [Mycobacterium sp. ITM-2016-00318]|uniref:GAP family protein n=1 Tax=Mycobacterium sp. ITM-2016-00318 TaxID=2099693 RepID=UPI001304F29F|nr:GAP family protein [Mycobacterium sp. ITM-2016-00318]WNG94286.1 GAP family protein [Mycobacterium sp. ITM-2016-00318]